MRYLQLTFVIIFSTQTVLGSDEYYTGAEPNDICHELLYHQFDPQLNLIKQILPDPITYIDISFTTATPLISLEEKRNLTEQAWTYSKVQTAIEELMDTKDIQTLIYPAAGFDSASGFGILPNLKTVIALDNHDFHKDCNLSEIIPVFGPTDVTECGFTQVGNVDRTLYLSKVILGRLILHFPKARILRVIGVSDRMLNASHPTYPHGMILFDYGPGTALRTYIHIKSQTTFYSPGPNTLEIYDRLSKIPFQAVLSKASMAWLDNERTPLPIVNALVENAGLWIDGDYMPQTNHGSYKSLLGVFVSWVARLPLLNRTLTEIKRFGYGQVELIQFHPGQKLAFLNANESI
jgi:uncharacterized protein YggT (Ycf19 family)